MDKEICKSCNTHNIELMWCMVGDKFVCLYCYNGTYTTKQVERIRNKKLN
jgi:hypothetical protein